jgi:hypothetical protein
MPIPRTGSQQVIRSPPASYGAGLSLFRDDPSVLAWRLGLT